MPSVHETAYPRLKSSITEKELERHYTPNQEELALSLSCANGTTGRLSFLVLLKTFQRLGYFVMLSDVPARLGGTPATKLSS